MVIDPLEASNDTPTLRSGEKGLKADVGRLGSRDYQEDRSKTVYPLPGSPGEDESVSPESRRETEVHPFELFIWFVRVAAVGYFAFVLYQLWGDTEIRLHFLHFTTRLLQSSARTIGGWGIQTEQLYGEFVDSLH